jgi:hypothetical protein
MSLVVKLIIFGWIGTFAMIGYFALNESGKLLELRKTIAAWMEPGDGDMSDQSLQPEDEDMA